MTINEQIAAEKSDQDLLTSLRNSSEGAMVPVYIAEALKRMHVAQELKEFPAQPSGETQPCNRPDAFADSNGICQRCFVAMVRHEYLQPLVAEPSPRVERQSAAEDFNLLNELFALVNALWTGTPVESDEAQQLVKLKLRIVALRDRVEAYVYVSAPTCTHGMQLNCHCEACFKESLGTNQRTWDIPAVSAEAKQPRAKGPQCPEGLAEAILERPQPNGICLQRFPREILQRLHELQAWKLSPSANEQEEIRCALASFA